MTLGSKRRLPNRFPVGTKFVIEGRRNGAGELEIHSRHLEFPDGTLVRLPPWPSKAPSKPRRRGNPAIGAELRA